MAQIHRFHDAVAVHVGDGQTVYLSPEIARKLGKALMLCAGDCVALTFQESNFKTVEIKEGDKTKTINTKRTH